MPSSPGRLLLSIACACAGFAAMAFAIRTQVPWQEEYGLATKIAWFDEHADEYDLVFEVTGKLIPPQGLPLQVGAVVSNVETLAQVADQAGLRRARRIERLIKDAKFREALPLSTFDWDFNPTIPRLKIEALAQADFIRRKRPGNDLCRALDVGHGAIVLRHVSLYPHTTCRMNPKSSTQTRVDLRITVDGREKS